MTNLTDDEARWLQSAPFRFWCREALTRLNRVVGTHVRDFAPLDATYWLSLPVLPCLYLTLPLRALSLRRRVLDQALLGVGTGLENARNSHQLRQWRAEQEGGTDDRAL